MQLLKTLQNFLAPPPIFARANFGHALISQSTTWDLETDPLQNSVVAACVNAVARALPDAPLLLENRTPQGWQAVPDHECLHVLRAPNEDHSDADVWGLTSGYKATHGQAFWLLLPDQAGRVGEIHVWNPERVTVLGDESHFISAYRLRREGGTSFEVGKNQVIHFRHLPDFCNPRLGWNPLRTGRAQIAGDNIGATYHTSLLHNAGVVSLLISLKEGAATGQVTPEQFQQVLTNIRRASRERAGGVEGINLPLEVHKLAYSPDEMNVDRLIAYYEARICAVMGVPQRVAGLGADPTYHNLSEALNDFWERRIVPDRNSDAATLNRQWLPLFGLDDGNWRFRFDFSQVPALQENRDALHARVREDFEKGLVDKKQARSLLGYAAAGDEAYAGVFFGKTATEAPDGGLSSSQITAVKGLIQTEWDESKHPRDEDGRFTDGGGGHLARSSGVGGGEGVELVEDHPDGEKLKAKRMHDFLRKSQALLRAKAITRTKNITGVSPKRMGDATNDVERHLLGLINNVYIRDDANFGKLATTISYVTDRIPKHLQDVIIEKVKRVDLFETVGDLNAIGFLAYGTKRWESEIALGAWVDSDQHLLLDGAGSMEEDGHERRKKGYTEIDFERARRHVYAHELSHVLDWHLKDREGKRMKISATKQWRDAFAAELEGKENTGFDESAQTNPSEAFAEMVAFLLVPESMDVEGFKPTSTGQGSRRQQAQNFCERTYPQCYAILKRAGII